MTGTARLRRASCAFAAALAGAVLAGPAAAAAPACRMELVADFKVATHGSPTAAVRVDGRPVVAVLDTGAFTSLITQRMADSLGLRVAEIGNLDVTGIGGRRQAFRTTLDTLEFGGGTFRRFQIVVVDALRKSGVDMIIGRDFLARTDLEFDLAHNSVRMLHPRDCKSDQMVYWTDKAYSQAPLEHSDDLDAFKLKVRLNAATVAAIVDSGAFRSVASLDAAQRAHVALTSTAGGIEGLGAAAVERRVGEVASITIGDETVKNTRLEFADLFRAAASATLGSHIQTEGGDEPEMVVGADFLASHRVLVSLSQKLVYFTYEGGPPFAAGPELRPAPAAPPPRATAPQRARAPG